MTKEEERKSICSIGTLKKTDVQNSSVKSNEIGVEADIPIEEESAAERIDISTSEIISAEKRREGIQDDLSESEGTNTDFVKAKVKVFDLSAGKVIEKDIFTGESKQRNLYTDPNRSNINISSIEDQRRVHLAVKTARREIPKIWFIVVAGLILVALILYLVFRGNNDPTVKEQGLSSPPVNLLK